jgi:hypothetical protein
MKVELANINEIRFKKFLGKENYDKWRNNFHTEIRARINKEEQNFFKRNPPINYIAAAFMWSDSPEGTYFWEELDNRWKEYENTKTSC